MIDSEFPLLLQKLEKENIKEKLHLIKAQIILLSNNGHNVK